MEMILSSKYLKNTLNKAIKNKVHEVEINSEKFLFHCDGVSIEMEFNKVKNPEDFKVKADYVQLIKLRKFLKLIPEQPIVVLIESYNYEEIRIELKHFIAVF